MAPSGSGPNGNTSRPSAARHWCFTFNNYTSDDINKILNIFGSKNISYIFQEESGENGTRHLQGYICLPKKGRPSETVGIKEIHWEKARNVSASILYCQKDDTCVGDRFSNMALPPAPREDTRVAYLILHEWQQKLEDLHNETPDDRTIHWIVDPEGGRGKTLFCKYLISRYQDVCVISATKSADIVTRAENYYKTYIIDIPRSTGEFCPFNAIEQLKNGFITDSKLKKQARIINCAPPHVIIFSNHYPDTNKLSDDRWNITDLTF